jgi:acyl-CoA thioesterase-2
VTPRQLDDSAQRDGRVQRDGRAQLDDLVSLLDLEPIEVNVFRGRSPSESRQRVFGGQVAGQAMVAAGRTVPEDRPVHSLHAYFVRPGDPAIPILYTVERVRDGRSFSTRRVTAVQHGRAIFNLSASFHAAEEGVAHQDAMPQVPAPESLPTLQETLAEFAGDVDDLWLLRPRPVELRYVQPNPFEARRRAHNGSEWRQPARSQVWMRAAGPLPEDPLVHACAVTYASDLTLLDSVLLAHGRSWDEPDVNGASLDHAMWFHGPVRADEWLLYDQDSPWAAGGRGLAHGRIFTADGRLAVSVVQEGLVRTSPRPGPPGAGASPSGG